MAHPWSRLEKRDYFCPDCDDCDPCDVCQRTDCSCWEDEESRYWERTRGV